MILLAIEVSQGVHSAFIAGAAIAGIVLLILIAYKFYIKFVAKGKTAVPKATKTAPLSEKNRVPVSPAKHLSQKPAVQEQKKPLAPQKQPAPKPVSEKERILADLKKRLAEK